MATQQPRMALVAKVGQNSVGLHFAKKKVFFQFCFEKYTPHAQSEQRI